MNSRRSLRRGVTMLLAITMLGLASAAMTIVFQFVIDDARRSVSERGNTQLRFLLLAGIEIARDANLATKEVTLPDDVGMLSVESVEDDVNRRVVRIRATSDGRSLSQRATFVRIDQSWSLELATIER